MSKDQQADTPGVPVRVEEAADRAFAVNVPPSDVSAPEGAEQKSGQKAATQKKES